MRLMQWASNGGEREDRVNILRLSGVVHSKLINVIDLHTNAPEKINLCTI